MNNLMCNNVKNSFRALVWAQIFLQIFIPLVSTMPYSVSAEQFEATPIVQSPFSVDRANNSVGKNTTVLPYADTMNSLANSLSSNGIEGVASSAKSAATGYASSSAQQWLSQFGTARVQLNVDDKGNWDDSAIDFLAPLYDNKKSMLFTQLGLRAPDGRVTGNLGMGVRTFYVEEWMFGGNVFLDDDFTGKNRRVGFGAEAWTNNLKLSANTYVGTTDWHQSRDFDDYNEKPADGYDVRAEGYLPAYPQLGAKLMYEQYYGDKVALFDTDHLQSNPSTITTGLSYTPIPLVQLAINYKRGQDSMDDTQFQVNFRYDLTRPLVYQLDPESVRLERSLAGSRYDLVERNNEIVLQYKKKEQQSVSNLNLQVTVDNSPSDGLTPNTAQVQAFDKDGQPVRNAPIIWSTTGTAKLVTNASVTNDDGTASVNFTNTKQEAVQITAKSGTVTATQNSIFNAVVVNNITLTITKDNSVGDGKTTNQALATLSDINNNPVTNTKVVWALDAPASLKNTQAVTDTNGQVTTDFTSTAAGIVTLTVQAGDKSASQQGHFTANPANNVIDTMFVTKDNSVANGIAGNRVKITVKDSSGAPVNNANVSLSADKGTVTFGTAEKTKVKAAKTFQTDAQGSLTVEYTDTVAETVQLTATLDNGNTKAASSSFMADSNSAKISNLTITTGALANGVSTNNATVTVVDANSNPLSGVEVTWTQDGSSKFGTSLKTDSNGRTTVSFTDTVAETVNITATLVNGTTQSKPSTFVADTASAHVSALTIDKDGSVANGTAQNSATATVVDAGNNILANTPVNWTVTGSAGLTAGTSTTNGSGQATITFTDTKAETITLTAKAGSADAGQSKPSTFVADTASAHVSALTIDTNNSPADGFTQNHATATVIDAQGNIVTNSTVDWSVTGSALLASSSSATDSTGKASITLTDTKIERVSVSARVGSTPSLTGQATFTGTVSSVVLTTNGAKGNKSTPLLLIATAYDKQGNPVPDAVLDWDYIPNSFLVCSGVGNSPTNSQGQGTMSCYTNSGFILDQVFNVTVDSAYTVDPSTPVTDSITYTLSP